MQSGSKAMTGGQLPDPDDEDPKKRKYEDAKYHHSQSSGAKSKAPNKGQEALDNSVPYGNKGDRVAVDKESNEFIVLMKDGPNSYHGHVRTWDGLTEGMKKALSENNLVRLLSSGSKAKIL